MTNQTLTTLDGVIAANIAALIEYWGVSRAQIGRELVALGLTGWKERGAWVRLASGERQLRVVELFAFAQLFRVRVEDLAIPELVSRLNLPDPERDDQPDGDVPIPQISVQPFKTMPALDYEQYLTDFLWLPIEVLPVMTQHPLRGVRFTDGSAHWATPAERAQVVEQLNEMRARFGKARDDEPLDAQTWKEATRLHMERIRRVTDKRDLDSATSQKIIESLITLLETQQEDAE